MPSNKYDIHFTVFRDFPNILVEGFLLSLGCLQRKVKTHGTFLFLE